METIERYNDKIRQKLPYFELTRSILNCCFEVMEEFGPGFLENLYKNALLIAMKQKGLSVEIESSFAIQTLYVEKFQL